MASDKQLRAYVSELEECLARNDKGRAQKIREELVRLGYRAQPRGKERSIPTTPGIEHG